MKTESLSPEPEVKYSKPEQNESFVHRISLESEGREIGFAELEYHSNPFAYYYVHFVFIKDEYRGLGFGSKIIGQINKFLDEHRKPGLLINAIEPDQPTVTIYEKHGWQSVPNHPAWFAYNTSPDNRVIAAIYQLNRREDEQFGLWQKETAA